MDKYNKTKKKFDICFAAGYAYSDGTEEITHSTLLKRADNAMYATKRKWYAEELNMKY